MGQTVGKRAVIGQEQQSVRIHIQPTDRIQPRARNAHKVGYVPPSLLVFCRADIAARLIDQNVAVGLVRTRKNGGAVPRNRILSRCDLIAQSRRNTVDRYVSGKNFRFCGARESTPQSEKYFCSLIGSVMSSVRSF